MCIQTAYYISFNTPLILSHSFPTKQHTKPEPLLEYRPLFVQTILHTHTHSLTHSTSTLTLQAIDMFHARMTATTLKIEISTNVSAEIDDKLESVLEALNLKTGGDGIGDTGDTRVQSSG